MRDVLIAEILHLDTNHFLGLEFQDSGNNQYIILFF